jgi:hypothetical protein
VASGRLSSQAAIRRTAEMVTRTRRLLGRWNLASLGEFVHGENTNPATAYSHIGAYPIPHIGAY